MPIIQRNTNSLSNLVYTTGVYINPPWITSLSAAKVGSGISQWNASQLRGYPIYTGIPSSGQVLAWTSSGWFPSGVTAGSAAIGVTSFNSRTGVVNLTSADVTGALAYTPYNNNNPSGYISSGYYTANSGVYLSSGKFSMGGTGTLDQLNFTGAVKIRPVGSDIVIGQNAASDNGYSNSDSISIGTNAGSNSTYTNNVFIGYTAGANSNGSSNIGIGVFAGSSAVGSQSVYIGQGAGITANGSYAIEISYIGGTATRIANDYDIHIQDVIGGNTSTRRLSFGDITMTPDANVEVISTESTTTTFIAKGAALQIANIIEARASDNSTLFYVDNGGYISTPSSGVATWNANQLKGYAVSGNVPATGQVLTWNGNSWYAADITAATALTLNYLNFKPLNTDPTPVEGRIWYDNDNHTLAYFNDSLSNNPVHIGQENVLRVYNATASIIPKGSVVYINGSHSKTVTVALALADINQTRLAIAVAAHDLAVNNYGYCVTQGIINDLNTNSFADGDAIYLSPAVAGGYTNVVPIAPNYAVQVGNVLNAHPTQGAIFVCPVLESVRGDHIVGNIYASPSGKIFTGNVLLNGAISGTLSNTNLTTIDSTPYSSGDCVKYIVKAKYGTAVQASEILITSDGTESYMTEYGLIYTSGLLADISTSYSSSNIILSAQATNSNTSIHMFKTLIS